MYNPVTWCNSVEVIFSQNKRVAAAVGIAKRSTKGQRLEWEMSIIRAEEEQAKLTQRISFLF
tara:strand:- start:338 stop:523 length:186 start_codon:yes stop_codon:yes gene_type:complete